MHYPEPGEITNKKDFALSCVIFLCAVVLLVSHAQTHLTVAFIGVAITALTLLCFARDAKRDPALGVDYQTLLFFIGLFVVVGGLEQTGVLVMIAEFIGRLCGGNLLVMIYVVMWISAVASSVVDNIPFAATMVPVIDAGGHHRRRPFHAGVGAFRRYRYRRQCHPHRGLPANVVGTSVVSKAGHPVSWGRYCKTAIPATVMVLAIAMIIIKVRYF